MLPAPHRSLALFFVIALSSPCSSDLNAAGSRRANCSLLFASMGRLLHVAEGSRGGCLNTVVILVNCGSGNTKIVDFAMLKVRNILCDHDENGLVLVVH